MSVPTFDDMRYLTPWMRLAERHGVNNAIKALIVWQTLNHWDVTKYPAILAKVFGTDSETSAKDLAQTFDEFWKELNEFDNRYAIIEGEHLKERVISYCALVVKAVNDWLLYDP